MSAQQFPDHRPGPQRIVKIQLTGIVAKQLPKFVRPERIIKLLRSFRDRLGFKSRFATAAVLLEPVVDARPMKPRLSITSSGHSPASTRLTARFRISSRTACANARLPFFSILEW